MNRLTRTLNYLFGYIIVINDRSSVIMSTGYVEGTNLVEKEQQHVHIIGDAKEVGNLKSVIWAANDLAIALS